MPINGHSRKGSLLVGEGSDIKKGPIAFGSVDSPNPLLSSSPAAPSLIGGHLANSVQSFGSVPADSSSPNSVQDPRRNMTTTAPNPPAAVKKPVDMHSFFVSKAAPKSQNSQNPVNQNQNQHQQHSAQSSPIPITSPPPMNGHPSQPPQFRPHMPQGQMRPNGAPYQPRPMPGGQGMPPYQQHQGMPYNMMGYPPQGYYQGGYDPQQQQFIPHWQQQQHQQQQQQRGPYPMSPRGSSSGLPPQASPIPHPAQLPTNGSASPAPNSRPPSFMMPSSSASSIPGTPGRPATNTPPAPFIPQPTAQPFSMSGTAPSFPTGPRKSAALKFKRPDGTDLDLPAPKASTTPQPAEPVPAPVAAKPAAPVVIKMESEEARDARLAEEAKSKKKQEDDEQEKKEKSEREAREAEEKRVSEETKAKEETAAKEAEAKAAEDKRKADEATAAEEASKKQAEEEAAKAKSAKDESDKAQANAAQEKADEQRKALLTPASSAPGSPSSPSIAGLPPKPLAASRRPAPAALDLKPKTPSPAGPSAMSSAKPITDLASITYNPPIQSPRSDLNKGAEPGQFRYDREFLMQFMEVCRERPERLPPLEEIGLEADTSSGFGRRPNGRGSSNGAPGRGLGLSGSSNGSTSRYPSQGMGQFGTGGGFGQGVVAPGRLPSSQDRYEQSKQRDGNNRGGQYGNMAPPRGTRPPSGKGSRRPPQPQFAPIEPDVAPLVHTDGAWVNSRPDKKNEDTRSPTYVARKVKSLLNKLTKEKFDSISKQILEFANYSVDETNGQSLKLVIKLIFDKATDEAHWSEMYAQLCHRMLLEVDPRVTENLDGKDVAGGALFRKYLIGRCQQDFETGWKEREDAVAKAAQKQEDDKQTLADHAATAGENSEPAVLSDEYYALQKAKRRGLGLVQLIGELFKLEMVSRNVMKQCFLKLLGNVDDTDEEDIESAIKLLTTIGKVYDEGSSDNVTGIMVRLNNIKEKEGTSSRVQFMIMDLADLRAAGWKGKKATSSVKTIAEIHQDAAREAQQKTAATNASVSRAGSSRGGPRNGPGDWQTSQSAAPRQQRPADFSNAGRIASGTGAPNFAPQSAFRNRRNGGNASTPPISRQPSQANIPSVTNANPFAALNDAPETAEPTEPAPQRRRLNLQPRTKPVDGESGEAAEEEDEGAESGKESGSEDEVTTPAQSTELTETAAKAKIDNDMKEFWGDKGTGGSRNPTDVVDYFRDLPNTHRPLLVSRILDDLFRLAKLKDAQVVAKAFEAAVSEKVVTPEQLKSGLETRMVSLDDDSIDFPQAYKAVGTIMRGISLSDEDIEALLGKVDVYGEPKITPKMKLDKALTALDEEAAQA